MKTKNTARFILFTLTLSAMLLSACSGTPATGDNSDVNGSPVTPFIVDTGNNANSNDANSNDNTNTNGNTNDSGIEIVGIVEAITEDTITINGVTYLLPADFTQFIDLVSVGDQVRVRVMINADGTFTILELEIITGVDNSNNANSNDANSNDDNGNDANSNDGNSNDDNGNDDNSNDANSNDDNGNDANSNDDNGNDDNSNDNNNDNDNGNSNDDNDNNANSNDDNNDNDNGGNDNG